jgi:hypothetical protein
MTNGPPDVDLDRVWTGVAAQVWLLRAALHMDSATEGGAS